MYTSIAPVEVVVYDADVRELWDMKVKVIDRAVRIMSEMHPELGCQDVAWKVWMAFLDSKMEGTRVHLNITQEDVFECAKRVVRPVHASQVEALCLLGKLRRL